jgi:hypothetical protein
MKRLFLFMVLGLVCCGTALAQVQNPGFEAIDAMTADPLDAANWSEFDSGGSSTSDRSTNMPRSGAAHMDLTVGGMNGFAGVFQNVGRTVSPGALVTLSGFHKSLIQPFNATRELKLEWQGMPNPPQLRVDEFAIGPDYEPFSLSGVAPAGTTGLVVTYAISTFGAGQSEGRVFIDDISVQIIPEPASLTLLGLAGAVIVGIRRRRK